MLPKAETAWTVFEAAHLLNRAGFGGSPDEISAFHRLGRVKAVDSLVNPLEAIDRFPLPEWSVESRALADMQERFKERNMMRRAARDLTAAEAEKLKKKTQQENQRQTRQHLLEAQGGWFRRMLKTDAPLREKMTLFWHDHFATSVQKVKLPVLLVRQNDLFRRHAFGSFKALTQEVLMDPAMMLYLDTQSSKKEKPNENFAREVMELFTLGEGHYEENDILQAARAFTGYQLNRQTGQVFHNRRQWDPGPKTIFGSTGNYDGKAVIDLIFQKPAAAEFICAKLWEFFVAEKPPKAAVAAMANDFAKSDFNVGVLLREIFLSEEFYSKASIRTQIKCPIQYLIGMLKHLEVESPPNGFPIVAGQQLGQVLFMPPNVAGWDWGKAWINTNTLLTRYNLAGFLTKGSHGGTLATKNDKAKGNPRAGDKMGRNWKGPDYERIAPRPIRENPEELVDALIFRFFQSPLPEKARESFVNYAVSKKGEVFTNQEVGELCHLILSTPHYQLT